MLTVALGSGATTSTARRRGWRGGLPHSSGTFLRGRFFGHTHTLVEDGMGSPPFSRTSRQRQPGGEAPARAGAQQARSPEHGLERGGVTTPPQPREGSGISRSPQSTTQSPQPTTSQSRPPALHRIPDSPKQQQPLRRRRNDEVARAQDEMVLSGGSGSGAARRLRNTPAAAAPTLPFGPLKLQQQQPPVVVIPEGGGAKPPPPSSTCSGSR